MGLLCTFLPRNSSYREINTDDIHCAKAEPKNKKWLIDELYDTLLTLLPIYPNTFSRLRCPTFCYSLQ